MIANVLQTDANDAHVSILIRPDSHSNALEIEHEKLNCGSQNGLIAEYDIGESSLLRHAASAPRQRYGIHSAYAVLPYYARVCSFS